MQPPDARGIWSQLRDCRRASAPGGHEPRKLALTAPAVLSLMLCVVLPAQDWLAARRAAHGHARALLVQVSQLPALPEDPSPAGSDPTEPSLIPLVSQTASAFGLAFGDFRADGDTRLGLELREGDFDALLGWLGVLMQQHGIVVVSIDVRGTATAGRVDAALVVARTPKGKRT
jgi:type II secretory pathway component PulM